MLLLPSLMCADFSRLGEEVDELCAAGADGFHLDVIDGHFVRNFCIGLGDASAICAHSSVPADVHLAVEDADSVFELFVRAGASIVYVHPEAERSINATLMQIARSGAHPGIAVAPGVSFATVEMCLPLVDYVLVMTVNPGFPGQSYHAYVEPKIGQFASVRNRYGYKIVIDGAITEDVVPHLADLGADGVVLGSSSLFGKPEPYSVILNRLHAAC